MPIGLQNVLYGRSAGVDRGPWLTRVRAAQVFCSVKVSILVLSTTGVSPAGIRSRS